MRNQELSKTVSKLRKTFRTSSTVTLLLLLNSCGSAPKLERPITLWSGAPEVGGICKLTAEALFKRFPNVPRPLIDYIFTNRDDLECIDGKDPRMEQFSCETWQDKGVEARYVETLLNKCQKWAP
jgi:hypothetical protein